MNRNTLAHLVGYSTLALILGTANWSSVGWVFAIPLVVGTLAILGARGGRLVEKVRAREPSQSRRPAQPKTATDGGTTGFSPAEVADSVRKHGGDSVRDDTIVQAIEQDRTTTAGDRNRRHSSSEHSQR